jgi:uncharacterized cupin superfamily protein
MTTLLSSPLSDQKLAPASCGLALAEWTASAASPGSPRYEAPLHVHHEDDEAWYVLAGRLVVRIGDDEYVVPAGAAAIGPRGLPHTFWNPDPVPARYVLVMSARTSALLDALHGSQQPSLDEMRRLFAEHGCELLG